LEAFPARFGAFCVRQIEDMTRRPSRKWRDGFRQELPQVRRGGTAGIAARVPGVADAAPPGDVPGSLTSLARLPPNGSPTGHGG